MSDKDQKGFIVFGDTKEVVDELSDEQAGRLFRGMLQYFVDGTDPDFTDALKFVFIPIRQQMDRNADKYTKMCDRNKQNARKRWDAVGCGRMRSDASAYDNKRSDAVDANIKKDTKEKEGTDTKSESPEQGDEISSLLSFFNSKTGSSYKDTDQFEDLINERLSEGYTFEDLRSVIEKKAAEWSCDGKMRTYLRPSTLFGEKFEEYLNAPDPIAILDEKKESKKAKELEDELKADMEGLNSVTNRIEEIRSSDSVKENYDELNELKLQQAIYAEHIENLKRRLGAS
jgi:uncharacterized phage protein (TIGR02220 family)